MPRSNSRPFFVLCMACVFAQASFAQLRNHATSENFRPKPRERVVVSPEANDGDISLQEYHRRRLIHEGLRDSDGSLSTKGLDREINKAFAQLTNPAALLGLSGKDKEDKSQLDQEARLLAEMDRQIERAREEQERWQGQSPMMAQAYDDENYQVEMERQFQEQQKAIEKLQERMQSPQSMNPQEMRELMRSIPGMNDGQMPEEFRDQMAENVYMALSSFRQMSKEEAANRLAKSLEGKPLLDKLDSEDPLIQKTVELFQDRKAIPSITLMVADRKLLIKFILANIAIFILGWIWKRADKKKAQKITSRFGRFFVRKTTLFALRLGTLIFFFGHLFRPAFELLAGS